MGRRALKSRRQMRRKHCIECGEIILNRYKNAEMCISCVKKKYPKLSIQDYEVQL